MFLLFYSHNMQTSLLMTVLGEMPVTFGKVMTFGSVAYVPQEAWVISDTVRQNILFGAPRNGNDQHYVQRSAGNM